MPWAVIGLGQVGRSIVALLRDRVELVCWDRESGTPYPRDELAKCHVAVVCVGTPSAADGSANVTDVEAAIAQLPIVDVLLKSTVPPGTTNRLSETHRKNIVHWPEYTGESSYYNPFFPSKIEEVPFVILGGPRAATARFIDLLLPILGPTRRYFQCSALESELAKYMENAYLATKVTFVNEFRRICDAFGVDWHTVREAWLLDPRVEPMHTAAFRDEPGFGGRCLPKDLSAIVAAATTAGYDPPLLRQLIASNEALRGSLPG
jgi:nucleotide sugar dehydrogenase